MGVRDHHTLKSHCQISSHKRDLVSASVPLHKSLFFTVPYQDFDFAADPFPVSLERDFL